MFLALSKFKSFLGISVALLAFLKGLFLPLHDRVPTDDLKLWAALDLLGLWL